jgi:uncharacterized membrane protein
MTGWRVAVALALMAAYAVASHLLMTHASNHPWTVAALFGPLLAAAAWSGWRARQPRLLLGCAVALVVLVGVVARGGIDDVNRLYVLQHAGIHLALAFTFGITLRAGAMPLIVAMGEKVHRVFTAEMRAYARRLTAAWVIYFVGMVAVSLIVYALAPWPWWSFFCNLITPAAAVAFFVGEHVWRHWRYPHFEPVSLRAAWDAYQKHPT